jgi:hypothetical protein
MCHVSVGNAQEVLEQRETDDLVPWAPVRNLFIQITPSWITSCLFQPAQEEGDLLNGGHPRRGTLAAAQPGRVRRYGDRGKCASHLE